MDVIYWDSSYNDILLLNLAITVTIFATIRFFMGAVARIDTEEHLFKKDNPAFGICLTGVVLAVSIVLSGLVYGGIEGNIVQSALRTAVFGVVSVILFIIARLIFDKITLPNINLRKEINRGNIAAAVADTGNVLAAAIIIKSVMTWITDTSFKSVVYLIAAYAISQVILTVITLIKRRLFDMRNRDHILQDELHRGNTALGLAFAGQKIANAFAFTIAANIVVYEVYEFSALILPWAMVSIAVIAVLAILSFLAEKIILLGHDADHEILKQRNIAAGALRAGIYISVALILAEV